MARQKKSLKQSGRLLLKKLLILGVLPTLLYFVAFCLFTWPWITHFNDSFMTDAGDGLQNVWNMWWVDKSVRELGQLPWYTSWLHHPFGVTLLGQTLNPFNGFVGIVLQQFMTLNQAFNAMIVSAYVVSGLTAFHLCRIFAKSYLGCLFGGAVFAFSSYHFAHGQGHMQLVSLQWIPLFILLCWKFVRRPNLRLAVLLVMSLLLVLLCDYYYFFYCLMSALGIAIYAWKKNELADITKQLTQRSIMLVIFLSGIFILPLPLALLRVNAQQALQGDHPARVFSTDVITPFLPGGFWRFGHLTQFYWQYIHANIFEATIYVGTAIIGVFVFSVIRRKKLPRDLLFWQLMVIVFGILSLGPRLMVRGHSLSLVPLPYALFERIVPGFRLSGMPVRMMVIVTLACAVISAIVLDTLKFNQTKHRLLFGVIVLSFVVEMLPTKMPVVRAAVPDYIAAVRALPDGAVHDDTADTPSWALYYQTQHEKKMPFGYVSREPKDLSSKEAPIKQAIAEGNYDELCQRFAIRYLVLPLPLPTSKYRLTYSDANHHIYDLQPSTNKVCLGQQTF